MDSKQDQSGTRAALLEAGLHLFGRKGFEGTSTRAIAQRADTNVASIAYHFGGKAGLRLACAEVLAQRMSGILVQSADHGAPETPDAAVVEMAAAIQGLVGLIVGAPDARDMVAFILRELADPGEVADLIFDKFLLPRHHWFCQLWSVATGQPADADEVKLSVFSLIGQVLYFRIAEPFVARRMGWSQTGPQQTQQISDLIVHNLTSMIERSRV